MLLKILFQYNKYMLESQTLILLICFLAAFVSGSENIGHYLSPSQLAVDEMQVALNNISSKMTLVKCSCRFNQWKDLYRLENLQVTTKYITDDEKVSVDWQRATVTGHIEFTVKFNYSIQSYDKHPNMSGWGLGYVLSDPVIYAKNLTIKGGWPFWNVTTLPTIKFSKGITFKSMNPYNIIDANRIQIMFKGGEQCQDPRQDPVFDQIKAKVDSILPPALKQSVNNRLTIQSPTSYTFEHPQQGTMKAKIQRKLNELSLSPNGGFLMTYYMLSDYWSEQQHACFYGSVPKTPLSQALYGTKVTIHSHCLYLAYVFHSHFSGYLNKKVDHTWQVPDFPFKAGSLYPFVANVQSIAEQNSPLQGLCYSKLPQNSTAFNKVAGSGNSFLMNLTYDCTFTTISESNVSLKVLDFTANTQFKVALGIDTDKMLVRLQSFEKVGLNFKTVSNFEITNQKLAETQAAKVLKNLVGIKLFGTGYPMSAVKELAIQQKQVYTIYYDKSTIRSTANIQYEPEVLIA